MKKVNNIIFKSCTLFSIYSAILIFTSHAQSFTNKEKSDIIDTVKIRLEKNYYFKKIVPSMTQYLTSNLKNGKYNGINNVDSFASAIEKDLYAIAKDKHIYLKHKPLSVINKSIPPFLDNPNFLNEGLTKVEVLEGNVGYIGLTRMGDFETDKSFVASAFNLVKNTDALIIDIRNNGGGTFSRLLTSYLLPQDSTHLITYCWNNGTCDSIYTFKHLDAPRYLNKPVYILTSPQTFSSAEEFAYDLKALKRAIVIGENTKGGANPIRLFPVARFKDQTELRISVPIAQVTNAITQSNWEGKGVSPDIEVKSTIALNRAHLEAVQQIMKNTVGQEKIPYYQKITEHLQADIKK